MKIKTYEYIKTEISDTEISIPQKTYYCFETGIRRSIRIIPIWTSWNMERFQKPEELYELEVTCVYQSSECKVEKFKISISQIESINNREEKTKQKSIITMLLNDWGDDRTKEDFDIDLTTVIKEINDGKI